MLDYNTKKLRPPYLILLGNSDATYAKTGIGLVQWQPEQVIGQLRFSQATVDLGLPDLTIKDAVNIGAKSLVIGIAPVGGSIPEKWPRTIKEAITAGLDIINGLHTKLSDFPELSEAAKKSNVPLIDIRNPPKNFPIGNHIKRTGRRLLTVGTDCAVGKNILL